MQENFYDNKLPSCTRLSINASTASAGTWSARHGGTVWCYTTAQNFFETFCTWSRPMTILSCCWSWKTVSVWFLVLTDQLVLYIRKLTHRRQFFGFDYHLLNFQLFDINVIVLWIWYASSSTFIIWIKRFHIIERSAGMLIEETISVATYSSVVISSGISVCEVFTGFYFNIFADIIQQVGGQKGRRCV